MTEDILFCAETGRRIGDGENIIPFPRPRMEPVASRDSAEAGNEVSRYVDSLTIRARLPDGVTMNEIVDAAAEVERAELREKFPALYDPI